MKTIKLPSIALVSLFSVLFFVSLSINGFVCLSQNYLNTECTQKDTSSSTLILTGNVVRFTVTSSYLENLGPGQTLWILHIKLHSNKDSNAGKLKKGSVLKTYSRQKLSSRLYDKTVKATIEERNNKYWLVSITPRPPKDLHLAGVLYGLVFASKPKKYAQRKDIQLKNDKAKVIIELEPEAKEPSMDCDLEIETRSENLISAWVAIDELTTLARNKGVKFIRLPYRPQPQT